ncbi:MAG: DeoR/GlpR transcriptional regulator [Gemmataceae bacterium]|nr:DeoR/GlpR transcriptional regulator [Gemmataceae bacterium]
MLVEERRQRVLDLVSSKGFASLADLANQIQVSESTVRRDLEFWHQQGQLRRTHGGAIFVGDGGSFPSFEERTDSQLNEKQAVARAAAGRVRDGETILLDGGTTTLEVARLLLGRSLQVVTNSLPIAVLLAGSRETDLVLLGGYIYPKTGVALGPFTIRMMQDLHVHQTLLSVSGLTERGLFNSNLLLVETERQMMRCADEVVLLADHTKIGKPALAFLCEWSEVDLLVIDKHLPEAKKSLLAQTGVRTLVAGQEEEFDG